jgi:uncharacterized surface protein with fasciclin (FAS1) repeats
MTRSLSIVLVASLLLVACGGEANNMPAQDASNATPVAKDNIVTTAVNAGQFKTLVAAVKAAGLADTLSGPGPYTVFAPTDEAFSKLPAGTVESLLKPENKEKLRAILTYHVLSGKVMSSEAVKLSSAKTVNGKELALDASSGSLKVGGANVAKADILASNGVIHVIDAVVLPELNHHERPHNPGPH